jgi:hypothetical protein
VGTCGDLWRELQIHSIVTLGGVAIDVAPGGGNFLFFTTAAHPEGQVDVVVTNPDGQRSAPLPITFVSPESFDPDGRGKSIDHVWPTLTFVIENRKVVSIALGADAPTFLETPVPVINGEFAFVWAQGSMSGRIVATKEAIGVADVVDWYWVCGLPRKGEE